MTTPKTPTEIFETLNPALTTETPDLINENPTPKPAQEYKSSQDPRSVEKIPAETKKSSLSILDEAPKKRYSINITTTKRGIPAMWEKGGGRTSGGSSQIITGRNGEARRPVYVRKSGSLSCAEHALITVHEGFYIVNVDLSRGEVSYASILKILNTSVKDIDGHNWEAKAEVQEENVFSNGEWDTVFDPKLASALKSAIGKASSYHCRSAYFIDSSEKKEQTAEQKAKKEAEMRRQDVERAKLRDQKNKRDAEVKAMKEAESKKLKESGLGERLENVNERRKRIEAPIIELQDCYFIISSQIRLYSEENVKNIEDLTTILENEFKEKMRTESLKAIFAPKFAKYEEKVTELGFEMSINKEVILSTPSSSYSSKTFPLSDDGLINFVTFLEERKLEKIREDIGKQLKLKYLEEKLEAEKLNLPKDIQIWRRRSGRTNRGEGWVITKDGSLRENDGTLDPYSKRYARYGEGIMIWEQILPGEIVLKWSKTSSASEHVFEVVHLPEEGLTEAQKEKILEIEEKIEKEWEGVAGVSSGIPSPSIENGFGLCKRAKALDKTTKASVSDLLNKFGR